MEMGFGETGANRRLPIYLLLDISDYMLGSPIQAVNQGINLLYNELMNDPSAIETVHISVITFGSQAQVVTRLTELSQFMPPFISTSANRGTSMGSALRVLNDSLNHDIIPNVADRRGDYKPLIFLIIAGEPTDSWEYEADAIKNRTKNKVATIIALGCGGGVNTNILKRITDVVLLMDTVTPDMITQHFKWVSQSVSTASVSARATDDNKPQIDLPPLPPVVKVVL
jgi:uncharacterized protein YegL